MKSLFTTRRTFLALFSTCGGQRSLEEGDKFKKIYSLKRRCQTPDCEKSSQFSGIKIDALMHNRLIVLPFSLES